jgi:UDPglucose--hexose-1-phosphate uridylyltransferase
LAELRWNPLLRTWVVVASHRQHRPHLDPGSCPFCPGSGKVPDDYVVYAYDNDFPSLSLDPPEPDMGSDDLIHVRPAFGKCEVTLYSPEHDITLPELSLEHIALLVNHWEERYRELGSIEGIDYVFIFENRGETVGVTMIHPHGQIYAYPYVPLKIQVELKSAEDHFRRTGRCLFCDLSRHEREDGSRVVYGHGDFTAFVPPFAEFPFHVHVLPDRHLGSLCEMTPEEKKNLALTIKCITGAYDSLYGFPFPYMMCMRQVPSDGGDYPHYHFHIEFYPPMQNAVRQKFNASSETGAWAVINPSSPEEKAAELKRAVGEQLSRVTAVNDGGHDDAGGDRGC